MHVYGLFCGTSLERAYENEFKHTLINMTMADLVEICVFYICVTLKDEGMDTVTVGSLLLML